MMIIKKKLKLKGKKNLRVGNALNFGGGLIGADNQKK